MGVAIQIKSVKGTVDIHRGSARVMWVGGIFKGVKCAVLSVYSPTNVAARAVLATQEQFYI